MEERFPHHCPHLGSKDDPATAHGYPSRSNRCFVSAEVFQPSLDHQEQFCLDPDRCRACPRFHPQSRRPVAEPLSEPLRERRVGRLERVLVPLAILLGVAAFALLRPLLMGGPPAAPPVETVEPAAVPAAPQVWTPPPTPSPTAPVPPVPIVQERMGPEERRPTPRPTETPTVPPADSVRIHIVQPGETLFVIAQQYGTTVEAIMILNGLQDRKLVYEGQEILIPPAGLEFVDPTAPPATSPVPTP